MLQRFTHALLGTLEAAQSSRSSALGCQGIRRLIPSCPSSTRDYADSGGWAGDLTVISRDSSRLAHSLGLSLTIPLQRPTPAGLPGRLAGPAIPRTEDQ